MPRGPLAQADSPRSIRYLSNRLHDELHVRFIVRQQRHGGIGSEIYVGAWYLRVGDERAFGLESILGRWDWKGGNRIGLFVAVRIRTSFNQCFGSFA